jgi:hypothetical protein
MPRASVFAATLAGLTLLAAGVVEALPLVFFGTAVEHAAVDHGRVTMLAGAALVLAAAAAVRQRRAAALLATAAVVPTALALTAPVAAFGLLALPFAIGAGVGAAVLGCLPETDRGRLGACAALGVVALGAAAAGGLAWGAVVAGALTLGAYLHARARGAAPRAALAGLAPGIGFALLAASAVLAGGALAA